MTDRELLELAAKAAGLVGYEHSAINGHEYMAFDVGGSQSDYWSPLTDDGDAFRLAVKLRMDVYHLAASVCTDVCDFPDFLQFNGPDPYATTRRAIVGLAAEIGRAMP